MREKLYEIILDMDAKLISQDLRDSCLGICGVAVCRVNSGMDVEVYTELTRLFRGWAFHSGDDCYPVPSRDSPVVSPHKIFYDNDGMWRGPYGTLRRDLLAYTKVRILTERELLKFDHRLIDPKGVHKGICTHIGRKVFEVMGMMASQHYVDDVLKDIFKGWEHHSGSEYYPVPSTDPELTSTQMFEETDNKWSGAYGSLRIDLLEYAKGKIQNEL